jgi:hypothetical protein
VKYTAFVAIALLALLGCSSRNVDSLEAVKQGVIADLAKSKNINIGSMDVNVVSVSFRDKEADAVVSFAPKGGTAAQGLTMNYTMERQGAEWHIKARAQSDLQKHAAQAPPGTEGGESPHGAMAGPQPEGSQSQLPAGHPPMGGADPGSGGGSGKSLPAGHPPLDK